MQRIRYKDVKYLTCSIRSSQCGSAWCSVGVQLIRDQLHGDLQRPTRPGLRPRLWNNACPFCPTFLLKAPWHHLAITTFLAFPCCTHKPSSSKGKRRQLDVKGSLLLSDTEVFVDDPTYFSLLVSIFQIQMSKFYIRDVQNLISFYLSHHVCLSQLSNPSTVNQKHSHVCGTAQETQQMFAGFLKNCK